MMSKINVFITLKGLELNRRFNSGSCHHFPAVSRSPKIFIHF